MNASQSVVMLMMVTRMTNVDDAGILMLAFALNNLFMTIGKYGIKNFQVTDVNNQFTFATYLKTRAVTASAMFLTVTGYLLYCYLLRGYSVYKCLIIFVLGMIYLIESVEDVLWGYYQRHGFLYKGAWLFVGRWMSILVTFGVIVCTVKNVLTALTVSLGVSVIVFVLMVWRTFPSVSRKAKEENSHSKNEQQMLHPMQSEDAAAPEGSGTVKALLLTAFPLFFVSFMNFFVSNNAKYAIDALMSSEVQACYGFVFMPVFVTALVSSFIYQPYVVRMAKFWKEGDVKRLSKQMNQQLLIAAGLTVIVVIGAYLLGIPVLSWLYHVDLSGYKRELIILMVASGFLAVSNFLAVINNVMRNQKKQMYAYGVISVISFLTMNQVVLRFGTLGAACEYTVLLFVLCIFYYVIVMRTMKKGVSSDEQ